MGFLKFLFWLPILLVVIIFAANNNTAMEFNLWPFELEVKISGALAILGFIFFGYIVAKVDSWFSYSPIRRALSAEKKQNKALGKKHKELTETISGLQDDISALKSKNTVPGEKMPFWTVIKNKFKRQG